MTDLLGEAECSLPGCVKQSFLHHVTREDLGYCCEDHRLRATERCLVSKHSIASSMRGQWESVHSVKWAVRRNGVVRCDG